MILVKCQNCGFENSVDANVCSNCGNTLVSNQTIEPEIQQEVTPEVTEQPIQVTPVVEPPKKKKKGLKGFITFLIVVGIIIGLFFGGKYLIKKMFTIEDPFPDIDYIGMSTEERYKAIDPNNSATHNIEADYLNGVINTDQYLLQLAYSIYEPDKLDAKYKGFNNNYTNPRELFEKFNEKYEELSIETLVYIFRKYSLDYVQWDIEDDAKVDKASNNVYDYKIKKLDSSDAYVYKLDHVILSKSKNFLVYYTKDGVNKITDDQAKEIANMAENAAKNYKSKYGYDFKYTAKRSPLYDGMTKKYPEKLVEKYNIDSKYLSTAMPIYVISTDSENTGVLGAYLETISNWDIIQKAIGASKVWVYENTGYESPNMIYDDEELATENAVASTTYAFPYFIVDSKLDNLDDTNIVVTHELFHHYQKYICGDGSYSSCPDNLFTIETTANLAAAQTIGINKTNTQLNGHAAVYAKTIEQSIENVGGGDGYAAYVFANNYAELVSDGLNKVFSSIKYDNPLEYLYNNSGGKYKDVLLLTAEKNLTQDYKNKLFISEHYQVADGIYYPVAHSTITDNYMANRITMNHSSMHYYYLDTSTLKEESMIIITGRSVKPNITLLLFIKENGKYKKVYSQDLNQKVVLKASDWNDYEEIAFAFVESSIDDNGNFYDINVSDVTNEKATVTPKSLGLKPNTKKGSLAKNKNEIMCYRIEETEYFKTGYQVLLNLDKDGNIDNMLMKGTLKVSDNVLATQAFDIAKKAAPGLILAMRVQYKQMLKNVRISTTETDNSWTILFKVTKDYDGAFTSTFGDAGNSKEDIINTIKAKGFTCE